MRDQVRATLRQLRVTPQRLRGQNFLCDAAIPRRIAAVHEADPSIPLLEIGPGLGALTAVLAESGVSLTALELEADFAAYLQAAFVRREQVRIIKTDALDFDYAGFNQGRPYRLYANVPYSITTPLLKRLLNQGGNWLSLTLMLQKEAAQRIVSGQGRANGPLTMLAQYHGCCRLMFDVPAGSFWPVPAVNSTVIDIQRREQPPVAGDIREIMGLVEAGFAERRKLLLNSLAAVSGQGREHWRAVLAACGLPETVRAEQMNLEDFARLLAEHKKAPV